MRTLRRAQLFRPQEFDVDPPFLERRDRVTGRIVRIIRGRSCGFIRTLDGRQVFFHASDVDGLRFHELDDELAVRFTLVEDRLSGPRATRVRVDSGL